MNNSNKLGLREWGMFALLVIIVVLLAVAPMKAQDCIFSVTDVAHGLTSETRFDIKERKGVLDDIEMITYQNGVKMHHILYHPIGVYPVKQVNGIWFVTLRTRELQHPISVQFSQGQLQFPKGYKYEDYFQPFIIPTMTIQD